MTDPFVALKVLAVISIIFLIGAGFFETIAVEENEEFDVVARRAAHTMATACFIVFCIAATFGGVLLSCIYLFGAQL